MDYWIDRSPYCAGLPERERGGHCCQEEGAGAGRRGGLWQRLRWQGRNFSIFLFICTFFLNELPDDMLLPHCTENPIYVFPEMNLHGLVPNSYIHVSVSDLRFPGLVRGID